MPKGGKLTVDQSWRRLTPLRYDQMMRGATSPAPETLNEETPDGP